MARPGSVISQGSQFGLGTLLLRYSRDYEKQADLLGAQTMARAGYDPRELARMFETIERDSKSSGGSGPQWMSSHPDPGNRTQYITREAESLSIASAADQGEFEPIKTAFASLPPAKSMRDLEKSKRTSGGGEPASRSMPISTYWRKCPQRASAVMSALSNSPAPRDADEQVVAFRAG